MGSEKDRDARVTHIGTVPGTSLAWTHGNYITQISTGARPYVFEASSGTVTTGMVTSGTVTVNLVTQISTSANASFDKYVSDFSKRITDKADELFGPLSPERIPAPESE